MCGCVIRHIRYTWPAEVIEISKAQRVTAINTWISWAPLCPTKKFGFCLVSIFRNKKLMVREGPHISLSLFFLDAVTSLLSPLCSQSISGLSFICGLSNICELGELHTYSDLPRYPSRAGQYNNNIWYWLLLLYSICSIKEWFKMQSYCSYKIVHTRRKIQCQFFSLNNDIRSLFYYMLSVH